MVMVKGVPGTTVVETVKRIKEDFGEANKGLLVLIQNDTGNCYGHSHLKDVIPKVLAPSAKRARTTLQLKDDAPVLQLQDQAPGHCKDKCTIT